MALSICEIFLRVNRGNRRNTSVNYPITVFRFGNVPLKAPGKSTAGAKSKKSAMPLMDDDFGFDE
jgi:hypothetical protein